MVHNLSNIEHNKIKHSYHYTRTHSFTHLLSLSLSLSYIKGTVSKYRGHRGLNKLKLTNNVMSYTTRNIHV